MGSFKQYLSVELGVSSTVETGDAMIAEDEGSQLDMIGPYSQGSKEGRQRDRRV